VWKAKLSGQNQTTGGKNIFRDLELGDPLESVTTAIQFLVFQRENCPTTGQKHYQCFLQTTERVYHTAFRKMLSLPKDRHVKRPRTR